MVVKHSTQAYMFEQPVHAAPRARCQVFTPIDSAVALWARFMGDLPTGSRVIEPTCGAGNMLHAIDPAMDVVGIECDPDIARLAVAVAEPRGWRVLTGNFDEVRLPWPKAHAIFGNPPWEKVVVDRLLDWAYDHLENEGRCGLVLPFNYTQYSDQGVRLASRWSIESVELPRDMFFPSRLQETVSYKVFWKTARRFLMGMFLYEDVAARRALDPRYQTLLREHAQTWRAVVRIALARFDGGVARLTDLYAEIAHRGRNAANKNWEAKVRQVLQRHPEFQRVGSGRWALVG